MPQRTLERDLGSLSFTSGGRSTMDLPRSHYYQRLNLVTDWDITVDTTGTNFDFNGIHELVQNISVTLNGNQTIKSVSHGLSHKIDHYQYGTAPLDEAPDLSSGSQQTGTIQTFVDFTLTPTDLSAMLPSFRLSDLTLEVEWGTSSDLVASDNITINDATMNVHAKERLRGSVAQSGQSEDEVLNRLMAFKEREKVKTLDSSGVTEIDLPRGNVYYAIPFMVFDDEDTSDTLVNDYQIVEDGVETHKDVTWDEAQRKDKMEYNVENVESGMVIANYGLRGNLTDVVATAPMDAYELHVDTGSTSPTATSEVRVVTQELIR